MTTYNHAVLIGNLTRDPETRFVAGDRQVTSFTIASTRKYKSNGELREDTTFLDCKAWGKTAEIIAGNCAKGRCILVEGHLATESWDDKATGAKRSKIVLVVDGMQFIGPRNDAPADAAPEPERSASQRPSVRTTPSENSNDCPPF